jgi:hypothetical protein
LLLKIGNGARWRHGNLFLVTSLNLIAEVITMKKLVGLLFVALFFLPGCGGSGGIVGTWSFEGGKYEFRADGTYIDHNNPPGLGEKTTYKLEGNKLHLSRQTRYVDGRESTESQEWDVKVIDNDTMQVNDERWKRVR